MLVDLSDTPGSRPRGGDLGNAPPSKVREGLRCSCGSAEPRLWEPAGHTRCGDGATVCTEHAGSSVLAFMPSVHMRLLSRTR